MVKLIAVIILIIVPFALIAQKGNITVKGLVGNSHEKPIAGASVSLMRDGGVSVVQSAVTDSNGIFEFKNLKEDTYVLTITAVGYVKFTSPPLPIDGRRPELLLPPIMLPQDEPKVLKAANVTSQKPLIEQHIDRVTVNVDAMITAAGGTAYDVLIHSPGVFIGTDGDISLNGKSGVLVLINNKPTYLPAQQVVDYLRSMPSSILDQVELMSNPPARYDASGNAVINIRLKKNLNRGFNGSLTASYGQGVYWKSNDALNVNYRDKKVDFFANISYAGDRGFTAENTNRTFYNNAGATNSSIFLNTNYKSSADAISGRVGMDYSIDRTTTIGFLLTGLTRPRKDYSQYTSQQFDESMTMASSAVGNKSGRYQWRNGGFNLNLQHRFSRPGQELNADLDYIRYHSYGDQSLFNSAHVVGNGLAEDSNIVYRLPTDVNIYSFKTDYVQPLRARAEFEAGIKSSYVSTGDETQYFIQSGSGTTPDLGQTSNFKYTENINSGYVTIKKIWSRWEVKAGARVENTQSKGNQLGNSVVKDSSFQRNYTNLFPTLFISRKLDSAGRHTLVLSYGRRILRPNYQQLNPFLFYRDKYSYSAGNPYLNSSYNDHIELSYRYKQYLTVGPYFDRVGGIVTQSTEVSGDVLITRPQNLSSGHMLGATLNLIVPPTRWWTFNLNLNVANVVNKGSLPGEYLDQRVTSGGISLFNQFRFAGTWAGELSGFWHSKMLAGQTITDPVYSINAGIQKAIWQGRGMLKLRLDDVFYTFRTQSIITAVQQISAVKKRTDSRVVGVVFNYRFGKEANARKSRKNQGGAIDEKNRVEE